MKNFAFTLLFFIGVFILCIWQYHKEILLNDASETGVEMPAFVKKTYCNRSSRVKSTATILCNVKNETREYSIDLPDDVCVYYHASDSIYVKYLGDHDIMVWSGRPVTSRGPNTWIVFILIFAIWFAIWYYKRSVIKKVLITKD